MPLQPDSSSPVPPASARRKPGQRPASAGAVVLRSGPNGYGGTSLSPDVFSIGNLDTSLPESVDTNLENNRTCSSAAGSASDWSCRVLDGSGFTAGPKSAILRSSQFEPEKHALEDLVNGLHSKVREKVFQDLEEISGQIKAAWNCQGQRLHHDLVLMTKEIKEEVKFEASELRRDLSDAIQQVGANCRNECQSLYERLALSRMQVDLSPVYQEIRDLKSGSVQVELSPLLREIRNMREQQTQVEPGVVAKVIREFRGQQTQDAAATAQLQAAVTSVQDSMADLSTAVRDSMEKFLQTQGGRHMDSSHSSQTEPSLASLQEAIRKIGDQVLSVLPSVNAVGQVRSQLEKDFSSLSQAFSLLRSDMQQTKAVEAERHGQHQGAFLQLREDMQELRAEIHTSVVDLLPASIGKIRSQIEADISALYKALCELRSELHLQRAAEAGPQSRGVELAPILEELGKLRLQVESSTLLKAHHGSGKELDDCEEQRQARLAADLSQILPAIKESRTAVLQAVTGINASLELQAKKGDVTAIVEAMSVLKDSMDLSPVLAALQDHQPVVDFAPVLSALRDSMNLAPVLAAIREQKPIVDFSPVFQAIRECRRDTPPPVAEHRTELDLSPILDSLAETRAALDVSSVLHAVRERATAADIKLEAVSQAIHNFTNEVLPALEELKVHRTDVDLAPVVRAMAEATAVHDKHLTRSIVLETVKEHRTEVDLSPVLEAIHEMRTAFPKMVRDSRTSVDLSPVLRSLAEMPTALDFSPILQAVNERAATADVKLDALSKAIHESKVDLSVALTAAMEHRTAVEVPQVRQAVEEIRATLDLSPVLQAVHDRAAAADRRFESIFKAVRETRSTIDFTPVLDSIRENRTTVDFTMVLQAIRNCRPVVDLSPVIQAVHESTSAVDFSSVLKAIHDTRTALDPSALMSAIKENRTLFDLLPIHKEIGELRQAISGSKANVDFSQVLDAIKENRTVVDLSPIRQEISALKLALDLSPLLHEVQECRSSFDLSPVLEAIDRSKTVVDFSQVLKAIRDNRTVVDFAPVLQAIRETQQALDLTPVVQAVHDSTASLPVLQACLELTAQRSAEPVAEIISSMGALQESIEGLGKHVLQASAEQAAVLKVLQDTRCQSDATLMKEIEALKTQGKLARNDLTAIFSVVQEGPMEGRKMAKSLSQVQDGIARMIETVEPSVVLAAIRSLEAQLNAGKLYAVMGDLQETQKKFDLSEVLKELREVKRQFPKEGVTEAVRSTAVQVDVSPFIVALQEALPQITTRIDVSLGQTVLGQVRQMHARLEATILQLLHEGTYPRREHVLSPRRKEDRDTCASPSIETPATSSVVQVHVEPSGA